MGRMIFPLLLAGHLIGDWVVQTDRQAADKTTSWHANQAHMLTYHLTLVAFVLPVWHNRWLLLALTVSWLTHSLIDRRWPVHRLMHATGSHGFAEQTWGVIAVDQALHISILAILSALAGVA
jgi:hypothetical protein